MFPEERTFNALSAHPSLNSTSPVPSFESPMPQFPLPRSQSHIRSLSDSFLSVPSPLFPCFQLPMLQHPFYPSQALETILLLVHMKDSELVSLCLLTTKCFILHPYFCRFQIIFFANVKKEKLLSISKYLFMTYNFPMSHITVFFHVT